MSEALEELTLLAYVLSDQALGKVHFYSLSDKAQDAWDELHGRFAERTGSKGTLPYAGLATALRAIAKTSVNFDQSSMRDPPHAIVSRVALDPVALKDAITVWEQVLLAVPTDEIRFSYRSRLAEAISSVRPETRRLADFIVRGDQPDAPRWVWPAATWDVAQRLAEASATWSLDGHVIRLRADTDGDLIVWDQELLWEVASRRGPTFRASMRVELSMATFPGMHDPVLVLQPMVSRLTPFANFAGQAWLAQRAQSAPLLKVQLEDGYLEYSSRLALQIFSSLRMQRVPIVAKEMDLADPDGPLRALAPRSTESPIGRGVGMYLVRELHHFTSRALQLSELRATRERHQFSTANLRKTAQGRDTELLHADELPAIIEASGCEKLRILVLYAHQHTRARMQSLLAYHFARPELAERGFPDCEPMAVSARVEVLVQPAQALLAHGPHAERAKLADQLLGLKDTASVRTVALCETEYDPERWSEMRRAARRKEEGARDPDDIDAKHVVNRLLAERGVATQFLSTAASESRTADNTLNVSTDERDEDDDISDPLAMVVTSAGTGIDPLSRLAQIHRGDHAGHNAIADLLRTAGLVHPRLTRALAYGDRATSKAMAYVGLHVRRQASKGKSRPKLCWSLVALIPRGEHWRLLSYLVTPHPKRAQTGWVDYTAANTAFRANPYPQGYGKDDEFTSAVDVALNQLAQHVDPREGYTLFVSGNDGARRVWPGLQNKNSSRTMNKQAEKQAPGFLPGYGVSAPRPRAVVRVSNGRPAHLPRPVYAVWTSEATGDSRVRMTSRALFRLETARDTWILSNVPRQFDGGTKHARIGNETSRWLATPSEQRKFWYAHTATEIYVVTHDGDASRYAIAAARLCHHAISWEGRTNYPAPIHLASQMDKNHPEYRRNLGPDDASDD